MFLPAPALWVRHPQLFCFDLLPTCLSIFLIINTAVYWSNISHRCQDTTVIVAYCSCMGIPKKTVDKMTFPLGHPEHKASIWPDWTQPPLPKCCQPNCRQKCHLLSLTATCCLLTTAPSLSSFWSSMCSPSLAMEHIQRPSLKGEKVLGSTAINIKKLTKGVQGILVGPQYYWYSSTWIVVYRVIAWKIFTRGKRQKQQQREIPSWNCSQYQTANSGTNEECFQGLEYETKYSEEPNFCVKVPLREFRIARSCVSFLEMKSICYIFTSSRAAIFHTPPKVLVRLTKISLYSEAQQMLSYSLRKGIPNLRDKSHKTPLKLWQNHLLVSAGHCLLHFLQCLSPRIASQV